VSSDRGFSQYSDEVASLHSRLHAKDADRSLRKAEPVFHRKHNRKEEHDSEYDE
jgi:hypothetical protein